MSDFNKEVGIKIKELRKQSGLTMRELGEMVGLTEGTIQRYETGQIKGIDVDLIKRMAKALNVSPVYILGWEDNNDKKESNEDKYIPETLAAHFDGDEFSKEDLEDIENFIEFVKQRKKGKG